MSGAVAPLEVRVTRGAAELGCHTFSSERVLIGRSPACHLRLDDPEVSRFHAAVERRDGCVLRDLRSLNGVRVRGRSVASWNLDPGDVVEVGPLRLTFSLLPAPEPLEDAPPRRDSDGDSDGDRTRRLPPAQARLVRERSAASVGWLGVPGLPGRTLVERDAVTVGSAPQANVRLPRGCPPWCAVLVRGSDGAFSLHNVAPQPEAVRVGHLPVEDVARLGEDARLWVSGYPLDFRLQRPPEQAPAPAEPSDGDAVESPPAPPAPTAPAPPAPRAPDPPAPERPRPRAGDAAPGRRLGRRLRRRLAALAVIVWIAALMSFFVKTAMNVARAL